MNTRRNTRPLSNLQFVKAPATASEKRAGEINQMKKELKEVTEKYAKLDIEHESLKLSHSHLAESLKKCKTEKENDQTVADNEIRNLKSIIENYLEAIEELHEENVFLKSKDRINVDGKLKRRDVGLQVCDENFVEGGAIGEHNEVATVQFVPRNILKVKSPSKFEELELALLVDENITTLSDHYLGKICQNIDKEYMQRMALETFDEIFLNKVSFKKGTGVYLKGTNIMKCWIRTIKEKFYAPEDTEVDAKISTQIQDAIRVLKNTLSQR